MNGFAVYVRQRRPCILLLSIVLLSIVLFPLAAYSLGSHSPDSGSIDIEEVSLRLIRDQWRLSATADIQLTPAIRAGLNSGVPLQFILKVDFRRPRRILPNWLPGRVILTFRRRYSLIYYELTRHYRLQVVDTNWSRNYRSLLAALDALGRLRDVVIPTSIGQDAAHSEEGLPIDAASYKPSLEGHMSIRLDSQALPLPLQPLVSSVWRLSSEEVVWQIN